MQELITYIILAITSAVVIRYLYRSFKGNKQGCEGCGSSCEGCPVSKLSENLSDREFRA